MAAAVFSRGRVCSQQMFAPLISCPSAPRVGWDPRVGPGNQTHGCLVSPLPGSGPPPSDPAHLSGLWTQSHPLLVVAFEVADKLGSSFYSPFFFFF